MNKLWPTSNFSFHFQFANYRCMLMQFNSISLSIWRQHSTTIDQIVQHLRVAHSFSASELHFIWRPRAARQNLPSAHAAANVSGCTGSGHWPASAPAPTPAQSGLKAGQSIEALRRVASLSHSVDLTLGSGLPLPAARGRLLLTLPIAKRSQN